MIGKQVFEVEYNSTDNGLVFRTAFTDFAKEVLLSVIEEVLDELAPKNTHVRIDTLDIQLDITYPFDAYKIKETLRKKLSDELNFKIVSIRHKTSLIPEETIQTIARTEEELLVFFLKEGYLPWWTSESKEFSVSIDQLLEQTIRKNPKQVLRILEKIKNEPSQIRRFIHHTSTAVLFELLAFASGIPQARMEAIKEYFEEEGFAEALPDFPLRVKEFMIFYFFIEKKAIVDPQELKPVFSEYLFERQQVKEYQLRAVFPEHYLSLWVERNLPSYFQLFREYIHRISIHHTGSSKEKKRLYQLLYETFLKHYAAGRKEMTLQIATELQAYSEPAASAIRKIATENLFAEQERAEETVQPISYFERLARNILQYLQYGVIAWQERAAGVKGIDRIIRELHEKHPEELNKIFQKIQPSFYPAVLKRIEEALEKQVAEIVLGNYFSKPEALAQWSALQYRDSILGNFFITGTAPWAEVVGNNIQFVEEIIYSFYEKDHDYFIRVVKESIQHKEEEEIVSFVRKVEFTFSAKLTNLIRSVLEDILLQAGKKEKAIKLPEEADLIVYYLSYFEKNNKLPEEATFTLEELLTIFINKFPEESGLYLTMAAYASSPVLRQKFFPELSVRIDRVLEEEKSRLKSDLKTEKQKDRNNKTEENKKNTSKKFEEKDKFEEKREPIYISNAGLILIHPFIQRFFSMCNLLEKRKFKNDEAMHKAVHLLQYVVNKGEQCEEHQLVLNKILCGLKLAEPIDRNIVLTDEEKETCESLIQGVVQNWPILKKTSNENFRASLLQREGRLTAEEAAWRLKVEERSFDMLLDKLPWSIGMIKLPWMEKVLHVEWR